MSIVVHTPLRIKKQVAASTSEPGVPAELVEMLTGMGFTEKKVTKALKACVSIK